MGGIIVFLLWFIFANLGIIFTYRQVFSVKIAIKVMFFADIGKKCRFNGRTKWKKTFFLFENNKEKPLICINL
jgi:hypothetical protein